MHTVHPQIGWPSPCSCRDSSMKCSADRMVTTDLKLPLCSRTSSDAPPHAAASRGSAIASADASWSMPTSVRISCGIAQVLG